jgi:hypothetical protein
LAARITTLISGPDAFEIIRDQIAAILVVESQAQQGLAIQANQNPALWKLRVFAERTDPWSFFEEQPKVGDEQTGHVQDRTDRSPAVNVWFDQDQVDRRASDPIQEQHHDAVFTVDCIGCGVAREATTGHVTGDESARREAQRAMRLVRQILMAGHYTTLGLTGLVGERMTLRRQMLSVPGGDNVTSVSVARYELGVRFIELSPQYEGQPLELISAEVLRAPNGQVLLRASFPYPLEEEEP